ncbi:lamin tail domain-containing protein [Streptomyces tsukubensis]|uniref:lamin tail domain-containing protein n=1 Tax=Streptomyces tsukubensis TaxID=83656 RepID=UPI001D058E1E|nr:lamin tail domain-containing protein [Streptomyces tsukubensis]
MRTHWRRRARRTAATLSVFALGLGLHGGQASAHARAQSSVRINEVESSGGDPGDWVELMNDGSAPADVSGWIVRDNDDSHSYRIAEKTKIAPGGFLALDVDSSFGLGGDDSVRLFPSAGATPVDSYSWSDHASTTYGRCPDGAGAFRTTSEPTKGSANACDSSGGGGDQPAAQPWPGGSEIAVADGSNVFGENLSGLSFESSGVLWAVNNGPSKLYRLVPGGASWKPDTAGGWSSGKALHYPEGTGDPDAEGVVVTPDGMFVSTERDNDDDSTSKPEILRFDATSGASSLSATGEWNLTSDLP